MNVVRSKPKPVLEAILLLAAVSSPVLFGSVHGWASLSLCGLIFLSFVFYPQLFLNIKVIPFICSFGFVCVFIFIGAQSFVFSSSPYDTRIELLKWGGTLAAFLAVISLNREALTRLLRVIALTGVVVSVYGLIQVLTGEEMVLWRQKVDHLGFVTGTFFNRNHFAGFLELCIGIQLGFLLKAMNEEKTLKSLGWGFLLLIVLCAFNKTGSRMGFIALAAAFALNALFMQKMKWSIRILFYFLIAAVGLLFYLGFKDILLQRLSETHAGLQVNDGGRMIAWRSVLAMIADYPWWGIGLGAFDWIFPYYQSAQLHLTWNHAHNDYLELLSMLGIPCAAVFLFSCFILISYAFFKLSDVRESLYPLGWGCLVSVMSLSFHAVADFNFAIFGNTLLYFMILAVIYSMIKRERMK